MQRMEDSLSNRLAEDIKIGEDNAICISEMRRWCKHVEIQSEAYGLLTEMTGLPINPHSIGCPQVSGTSSSMNLRWIVTDFLNEHCAGCPHHSPNGDTSWGQEIIDGHREESESRERVALEQAARISNLRSELRSKAIGISREAEPDSYAALEYLEKVFSEDEEERKTSLERLRQVAKLGADILPNAATEMILELAGHAEFAEMMLPICQELAVTRPDLSGSLVRTALENIEKVLQVELSAAVLDALGGSVQYPLDEGHVRQLMLSQNHSIFSHGFPYKEPVYAHNTSVLIRSFDANPESVRTIIRHNLQDESERVRFNLGGALALIQAQRPSVVENLLNDLVDSLELQESDFNEAPSGQIARIMKCAFGSSPRSVDEFMASRMKRVRSAVQQEFVRIYESAFDKQERRKSSKISVSADIAIERLLEWIKDEQLALVVRVKALEALKQAARNLPSMMSTHFEHLLGYLAIVSSQELPSTSPSLIIPGQPSRSPLQDEMDTLRWTQ